MLPCDVNAERAVIGALMNAPDSLAKVSDTLCPEDFSDECNAFVYRAITELSAKNEPFDAVTLTDWFASNALLDMIGGPAWLLGIANEAYSAANIQAHASIVREKALLRKAADIGARLAQSAQERGAESAMVYQMAAHEIAAAGAGRGNAGLMTVKAAMTSWRDEFLARYHSRNELLGLKTPWAGVNRLTRGLRRGCLYIVAGRPGMGKSVFGLDLAAFVAISGLRVLYFSVEMTKEECIGRMVASLGKLPHEWVEQPDDTDEARWVRFSGATTTLRESKLDIDDTAGIKIEQLAARAKRAHLQAAVDLIVIDHLHDMGTEAGREMRHELGRITQGVKALGKQLNCAVMLLAQLNRAAATRSDKRPSLTDLRESGEIEQKADFVGFLHREEYYDRETYKKGLIEFIPAKGRNIRIGEDIPLYNRFDQMRMEDWEGPLPKPIVEPAPKRARGLQRTPYAD